jgi:hypothetical protein
MDLIVRNGCSNRCIVPSRHGFRRRDSTGGSEDISSATIYRIYKYRLQRSITRYYSLQNGKSIRAGPWFPSDSQITYRTFRFLSAR